jgi:phage-related protein
MGGIGRVAGKGLALGFTAAAGGIIAAGAFLKGAFDEADEARKVGAQTAAVIKSTGGVAGITAGHVSSLSTAISKKIGVDDEAIQSGQNMLLTFSKVRNEVGKGNAIFDRATVSASDMAAAFGGDAVSNSKMLGKALNDPTKGVAALTRVGVSFTEQQKEQIKTLQESGDFLGAQKIILGEVEKQTKGSAASQATAAMKAGVAWGNLKETVGTALMPAFDAVFTVISNKVIPSLYKLGPIFVQIGGFIGPFITMLRGLFDTFKGSDEASGKVSELRTMFSSVFTSIKTIVSSTVTILTVLWQTFGANLVRYISGTLSAVMMIVRGAFKVIAGIFKVVSSLLTGDWKGVWDGIKQILAGAWLIIKGIVKAGWVSLRFTFTNAGAALKGIFGRIWDGIKALAGMAWDGIVSLVKSGAERLVDFVKSIPGRIVGLAGIYLNAGKTLGSKIIGGIMEGLRSAGGFVSDLASSVKSAINSALHLPFHISGPGPLPDFDIPAFARGTKNAPGGMALVGENGPELVNLPRGSEVVTAARTRALAGSVAGGAGSAGGRLRLVEGTLYIDESGRAFIRGVAEEVVGDAADFDETMGSMR